MSVNPPSQRKKKSRPVRPKHVPVRTCIACRTSGDKRTLTRIVRIPELDVRIDPTGKANGRGAYLCDRPACWERAIGSSLLARSLNVELTPVAIQSLKQFAATLPAQAEPVEPALKEHVQ